MNDETENGEAALNKQDVIKKMLELQRQFIDYEHSHNGVPQADYYTPEPGHPLENYRDEYTRLANLLVDMAHAEQGSNR